MPQTNPRAFIALLEVFRICILNKVMNTQRVIDWADAIIEQDAAPDYFIIELAMCGSKNINDIISLLNSYIGKSKPSVAGRITLGFIYQQYTAGEIDLYRVVGTMDWLAQHGDFTDEERGFMCGVDDEYSMAVEGVYGSVSAVADYVMRFLPFYQAFNLENMAAWDEINESIPGKVRAYHNQLSATPAPAAAAAA